MYMVQPCLAAASSRRSTSLEMLGLDPPREGRPLFISWPLPPRSLCHRIFQSVQLSRAGVNEVVAVEVVSRPPVGLLGEGRRVPDGAEPLSGVWLDLMRLAPTKRLTPLHRSISVASSSCSAESQICPPPFSHYLSSPPGKCPSVAVQEKFIFWGPGASPLHSRS